MKIYELKEQILIKIETLEKKADTLSHTHDYAQIQIAISNLYVALSNLY